MEDILVPNFDGGSTIKILVWRCDPALPLASEDWAKSFLLGLCIEIGMTRWLGPFSGTLTHPLDPSKSGVSAVLMIQESHIAIHTWPAESAARIVIDSCRDFDVDLAVFWVRSATRSLSYKVCCDGES